MNPRLIAILILMSGCTSASTPNSGPDPVGQWGSREASLVLKQSGGTMAYQCGHGSIAPSWTVEPDGSFEGVGQHYFGGGPVPEGGRQPHPASYSGTVIGDRFTLNVTLTDLSQALGPFNLVRNGSEVTELCF